MYIRRDFQITNAALGEELRSKDGRSVVKVTHHPIPPAALGSDSDSGYDSELDSDDDEDEELDDEEEQKEDQPKVNGHKEGKMEVDEDDEDEDEDEDEDDEDFSDDEDVEETSVLCALTAGKVGCTFGSINDELILVGRLSRLA